MNKMNILTIRINLFFTAICASFMVSGFPNNTNVAFAAANMIPTYEVKYLLDSEQVLNDDRLLKKVYRNMFETGTDYKEIGVLYLETEERDFGNQGWINRIRIKEDDSDFELTFKKRYKVINGNLNQALTTANTEGFNITDTNYTAEVDWGYANMTLSLTRNKKKSNSGYGKLELPKKEDAIEMIKDEMPGKEEDWLYENWGKDKIKTAKKAGPLTYQKHEGTYDGEKIVIEIWPIQNQSDGNVKYITELSFKADSFEKASALRTKLMDFLDSQEILIHNDSLKTQAIMDAYLSE